MESHLKAKWCCDPGTFELGFDRSVSGTRQRKFQPHFHFQKTVLCTRVTMHRKNAPQLQPKSLFVKYDGFFHAFTYQRHVVQPGRHHSPPPVLHSGARNRRRCWVIVHPVDGASVMVSLPQYPPSRPASWE